MNPHEEAPDEKRCGACKHWHKLPGDPMNLGAPKTGLCRAVPPVPIAAGQTRTAQGIMVAYEFIFPSLREDALSCGMYEERLQLTIKN